ncbi:hypothetical protein [Nocardioides euryhalodurans]|uniref:Uncharacterized protein n=1 Tax=Nocardioides euryhalodurans TaxID=2518370 RepID=A0A4P7GNI1_9ACTN|nr:hypothetical protein [Nocardioides euryhalodurans]QBR93755.1 hypothetical protein EXE57_16835 [Nocardioides euryhalodurans]
MSNIYLGPEGRRVEAMLPYTDPEPLIAWLRSNGSAMYSTATDGRVDHTFKDTPKQVVQVDWVDADEERLRTALLDEWIVWDDENGWLVVTANQFAEEYTPA